MNLFRTLIDHTIFALFLLNSSNLYASTEELPQKIAFEITDLNSQKIVITGDEIITFEAETTTKVTTYNDMLNTLIQKETIVFNSKTLTTLSFHSENFALGEVIDLSKTGDSYLISYKESKNEKASQYTIKPIGSKVLGKVLHNITIRNWKRLKNKESITFPLLIPSKQKTIDFNLTAQNESPDILKLLLEPDSWIIQKFVDPMYFFYSNTADPLLVKYEGPTTVLLKPDYPQNIRIDFHYPLQKPKKL